MDDGLVAKMIKYAVTNVSTAVPWTVTHLQDVQELVTVTVLKLADVLIPKPTMTSVFVATFASFAAKIKTKYRKVPQLSIFAC